MNNHKVHTTSHQDIQDSMFNGLWLTQYHFLKILRGHSFNWKLLKISPTHIIKNRDPHFNLRKFDVWKRFQKYSPKWWFDDESHGTIRKENHQLNKSKFHFSHGLLLGRLTYIEVMFLLQMPKMCFFNRRNQQTTTSSQNAGGKRPWNALWITNGMFTSSSLPTCKRAETLQGNSPKNPAFLYRLYDELC